MNWLDCRWRWVNMLVLAVAAVRPVVKACLAQSL